MRGLTAEAFHAWASDVMAELDAQDEDVLLHEPEYLPMLVDAAADPGCPKQMYCARILEDYARRLVAYDRMPDQLALRAAAERARRHRETLAGDWAAYAERLLGYREHPGPVDRARAERMATDLLIGPLLLARLLALGRTDWVTVRLAEPPTHWEATHVDVHPRFLYVHRRTGAFRLSVRRPLPAAELKRLG